MIPESESESKPGLLESELELESHDAGIGIRVATKFFGKHYYRNQNRNHLLLELEPESLNFVNPGIGIGIRPSGIGNGIGITRNCRFGIRLVGESHVTLMHMLSGVFYVTDFAP